MHTAILILIAAVVYIVLFYLITLCIIELIKSGKKETPKQSRQGNLYIVRRGEQVELTENEYLF